MRFDVCRLHLYSLTNSLLSKVPKQLIFSIMIRVCGVNPKFYYSNKCIKKKKNRFIIQPRKVLLYVPPILLRQRFVAILFPIRSDIVSRHCSVSMFRI